MKEKYRIIRICISGALFISLFFIPIETEWLRAVLYGAAYLIAGADVLLKAVRNIFRGHVFDENFLMTIASIGAFAIGEYPEGAAVMLFYQVGETFQSYAVSKSRRSISELMDIRPDYANIVLNGDVKTVSPSDVHPGDIILIKPGERIPLDAVVIEGSSTIDMSALNGESVPKDALPGQEILSGGVNLSGVLKARVTKEYAASTASLILDLVENASSKKSKSENFITKFSRYYTPAVVIIAVLLAVVPTIFMGTSVFSEWLKRALVFLVVSCPCALVISVPLSFFGGIGGASKQGILIKGGNYIEALSKADTVVFDKTGTLTKGVFEVKKIVPSGCTEQQLLTTAAMAESLSNHPISASLKRALGGTLPDVKVENMTEIAGHGVKTDVGGKSVLAGNLKLLDKYSVKYDKTADEPGTVVYVAADGVYMGYIIIADEVKPDAASAVNALKNEGMRTVMLTGDAEKIAKTVADDIGIDEVHAELLPGDKVAQIERLIAHKKPKSTLVFVGDGINDAPVLARADVGIAMGGLGSDAAIEAADVVIMTDEPSKILTAVKISKKTLSIAKQNIYFALIVKFMVLALGAFGVATMWEAVIADVGVAVIAILNAMRALKLK